MSLPMAGNAGNPMHSMGELLYRYWVSLRIVFSLLDFVASQAKTSLSSGRCVWAFGVMELANLTAADDVPVGSATTLCWLLETGHHGLLGAQYRAS